VPRRSHQSSSTHDGVRKHVPPLIVVDPPTMRPTRIGIATLPTENVAL
jgi:hypothetical protein